MTAPPKLPTFSEFIIGLEAHKLQVLPLAGTEKARLQEALITYLYSANGVQHYINSESARMSALEPGYLENVVANSEVQGALARLRNLFLAGELDDIEIDALKRATRLQLLNDSERSFEENNNFVEAISRAVLVRQKLRKDLMLTS